MKKKLNLIRNELGFAVNISSFKYLCSQELLRYEFMKFI